MLNLDKSEANGDRLVTFQLGHFSYPLFVQSQVGIGVRLTFETLEGEKTSSELTVVNNGTVAIWYDWRRRPQPDFFQDLKKTRMQRFYFNNREGSAEPPSSRFLGLSSVSGRHQHLVGAPQI